jgi:peptidoglycan/LPS O-acetylase OafA/YrhL
MKYRSEIDGLRAIAIIPVVLFHAGYVNFRGGFVGVDIFFVISGYLITSIILNNLQNRDFNLTNFYSRRIKRLFPLLTFVSFVTLILSYFVLNPEAFTNFGKIFIGIGTFSSNLFILLQGGYFAKWVGAQPLTHTWSLSVEEQFYLFFPALLVLLYKKGRMKFWIWIITLTSFILAIFLSYDYMRIAFFILPTRAWELGAGVLASLYIDELNNNKKISNKILSFLGIVMIVISFFIFDSRSLIPGLEATIPVLGTFLVIIFSTQNTLVYKFLNFKPLRIIGILSFSIYLWHHPVIILCKEYFGENVYVKYRFAILLLILFISILSYFFIENPIRNTNLERRKIFKLTILFLLIEIIIGIYIWQMDGFINKHKAYSEYKIKTKWDDSNNKTKETIEKYGGDQYSIVYNINKPITDLLIGDSHANHFYPGLSKELSKRQKNLLMIGAGGCTPLLEVESGFNFEHGTKFRCYDRMNSLYKITISSNKIDTVYIAFSQYSLFDSTMNFYDKSGEIDFDSNRLKSMILGFKRTIDFINSTGSNVVFIEDLPDIDDIMFRKKLLFSRTLNENIDLLRLKNMNLQYLQLLDSLDGYNGTKILRTRSGLLYFPYTNKGNLLYRDNTHLTKEGSLFIIEESFKKK